MWAAMSKKGYITWQIAITGFDVQPRQTAESSWTDRFTMPTMVIPRQNSRTSRSMRIVDVALASVLLVLLCPLLILIAVAIRVQSPGPVLVRKSRTGLYVFRTTSGPNRRTTRLGWFLQQSSLYTLPQLFSVILGNSSLVKRPESEK